MDTLESTIGTDERLETLQQHPAFEMNAQEKEVAKQLFEQLKSKQLSKKPSLYKLLAKVDQKDFAKGCTVSVFFGSLTPTIKDTGCLTSMLKLKHTSGIL